MRKIISLCLIAGLLSCGVSRGVAEAYDSKPKLVVILVIDQFRGDIWTAIVRI